MRFSRFQNSIERRFFLGKQLFCTTLERLPFALSTQKATGYIGCHQGDNLGDLTMHYAALELIGKHRLIDFHAAGHEALLRPSNLTGRTVFNQVLLGGGTLINPYFLPPVEMAKNIKVPFWTFGTGVGSVGFEQLQQVELEGWAEVLSQANGLGVRGPLSESKLRSIGCQNAEVVGDPALFWAIQKSSANASQSKRILFNLAGTEVKRAKSEITPLLPVFADVLRSLHREEVEIVAVAMTREDRKTLEEFSSHYELPLKKIHQPQHPTEFIELAQECTVALVMRLHAAVLSCCSGVVPIVIGYRDKCLDFMLSMDLPQWHLNGGNLDSTQLKQLCAKALNEPEIGINVSKKANHLKSVFEAYVKRMGTPGTQHPS